MAEERVAQWPLTAAATELLLLTAPAAAKRGNKPADGPAVKLALKELLARGALRVSVEKRRMRRDVVTLYPGTPAALPPSLAQVHALLAPYLPGEVSTVIRMARAAYPTLVQHVGALFRDELRARGLVEEREEKTMGLFRTRRWRRTAAGDQWAASAEAQKQALMALPQEAQSNPDAAVRRGVAAGALVLAVPVAMATLGRLRAWRRQGHHSGYVYHPTYGDDYDDDDYGGDFSFDPVESIGDLFDSVAGGIDAGLDAVDSAFDSVTDAIDSGIDAGVDAGGGGDGGGGDGGGGDGGGGGGGE